MSFLFLFFAFLAAVAAGVINAIAGGGTLITFPVLTAIGLSPVVANVTNTVALCPGLLSGAFAQRKDFQAQKQRLWKILPAGILGGIAGGLLLLNTTERSFNIAVPFLIFGATILLGIQVPLRNWVISRIGKIHHTKNSFGLLALIFAAAIYGGYFGAGLGIILMAVLGLMLDDSLTSLNILKQAISFCINLSAAIYFSFSGKVDWLVAVIMAVGAITGGAIGGKLAGKIKPEVLRWIIVFTGTVVAFIFWSRLK